MPDQKIKILIIDDDNVDRMAITRVIKDSGIAADIFNATDMETGTALAFEKEFDCIFLDYDLPGNNGFEFLENYRNKKGQSPVIFVTSHADEKLAVEAIKKGASVFIPKNQLTVECITQLLSDTNNIKHAEYTEVSTIEQVPEALQILETIVANAPLIIFSIDQNGIFNFLKGKGIENFLLTEEEITGKSIFDTGLDLPIRTGDYKNALLNNNFISVIEMNDRFYQVHYMQIKNDENNTIGINGVALDITTLKKQEQELKNALAVSEETQKIKDSFLANTSHEVRTPIHGIINLTDILLKTEIKDEQLKYLEAIKSSAGILRVIINDILDLSKIEAQKMRFENAQFHLRDIVHGNIEMFRTRAEEKQLKLFLNYDENLSEFLNGDSVRLSQVINNLLNNAIKFTDEGEIKMEVFTEEKNENFCLVTFKISDTGIGIPQHKLSSIFDSFEQASDDINRKYGGTGLGLNICKKLVELQGGMISVESMNGKGSTFIFKLPFENIVTENSNSTGTANNSPQISYNKELKILVVEDNDINRMVIDVMMRDWNFKTDNATNGSEAIDMIEQNHYDVVLMDIEMPGLNGYQITEHIRKNLAAPKNCVPVLAMTAHANSSQKERCLNSGMNDYVSKPFDAAALKNKIITLCDKPKQPEMEYNQDGTNITEERLTNLTFLRQLSDNNETFFKDFISLFLQNAPQTVSDLSASLEKKDWNGVGQAAHKIKPTLSYLGMKEAHLAASKIEECAKNLESLNEIPGLTRKVIDACNTAYNELEQELKEISI